MFHALVCGGYGVATRSERLESTMTRNSGWKRAARQYQVDHPGTPLPEALRVVREQHEIEREAQAVLKAMQVDRPTMYEMLRTGVRRNRDIENITLSVADGEGSFRVFLGPEIEEDPITIDEIDIDFDSLTYTVQERFEGDTIVGETLVNALVTYSAPVFKSTYYSASDDVSWEVVGDLNERYIEVRGELSVELVYQFTVHASMEEVEDIELIDLIQVDDPRAGRSAAS